MKHANRNEVAAYLRNLNAPERIIRGALGEYGEYSEDTVFNSSAGRLAEQRTSIEMPPRSRVSFTCYVFHTSNTSGNNGSVQILPSNDRRQFLLVQNQAASGGGNLYVNFSGDAGLNIGIQLVPGGGVFFDYVCPYNAVAIYFDSATVLSGVIVEGATEWTG